MKGFLAKATRQHTKNHNSRLVFRIIYEDEAISRADIARKTGLTRTTVSAVVSELIEQGLIEETGTGQSSGGRLPVLLRVAHEAHGVLALSFEDMRIVGALVDMRGGIQQRVSLPLYGYRPEELPDYLSRLIDELRADATTHILGIGLSMPGIVDPLRGIVRRASILVWSMRHCARCSRNGTICRSTWTMPRIWRRWRNTCSATAPPAAIWQ